MKNIVDCNLIKEKGNETSEATRMKKILCRIGNNLGFMVDIEEPPISEMGSLSIRHDVLWYIKPPEWYNKLLSIIGSRKDLEERYQTLIEKKKNEFLKEIYQEQWYNKFDIIKDNFNKNKRKMPKKIKEKELETFAVKFTYTTNKIEGSTLTHRETALLLEKGITPEEDQLKMLKKQSFTEKCFMKCSTTKKISQ